MRAAVLIRAMPHYRRYAFCKGLETVGYRVSTEQLAEPQRGDVVVMWNRYGQNEEIAHRYERARAQVLVCENGYLGKDSQGRQFYAIARNQHNGAGTWPERADDRYGMRWKALGIELDPPRTTGTHILVCPSRGIGPKGVAMPAGWEKDVLQQLRRHTRRPVRVRPHPNDRPARVPLAEDLEDCWAVVIWNSAAGVHAVAAGVQVISCAPHWVLKPAAPNTLAGIDGLVMGEREPAFERLAWAQWSVEEIESGVPFHHLLSDPRQGQVAQAA